MKRIRGNWRIGASIVSLFLAIACLYKSLELGVTAEEGLKYNPDVTAHPYWQQMDRIAGRWGVGAEILLFTALALGGWQAYRYFAYRRTRLILDSPRSS